MTAIRPEIAPPFVSAEHPSVGEACVTLAVMPGRRKLLAKVGCPYRVITGNQTRELTRKRGDP